ncbi:MAG: hypothetical protein C0407_04375 [Desulfobacca sp.]|nr:hypothetical protein [Desulfobacca sp.]
MRQQFLIFISLALFIYYGLHALLFLLLVKFFSLRTSAARLKLGASLFILSLSFLISFIWLHNKNHGWISWFYYSSALWLGVLVNLLLIFGAGLLLVTCLKLFSLQFDLKFFGVCLLIFTVLYTCYGLHHAAQIKKTFLSVPIKNLPPAWQGKKIAQISDSHLGTINGEPFARKIAELINEQKVNLVFLTGDILDGSGDDLSQLIKPFEQINAPIFYITGNHETYLGINKVVQAVENSKIKLLRDEIIDLGGLQVIGIDYPSRGYKKDLKPILEKIDQTNPSILLWHQPSQIDLARQYHVSLQLSGHTHNGQMWPMKLFPHLIYKGYDYGLHQIGDFYIYTTSGVGTWGPPMRIGSTPEIAIITIQ